MNIVLQHIIEHYSRLLGNQVTLEPVAFTVPETGIVKDFSDGYYILNCKSADSIFGNSSSSANLQIQSENNRISFGYEAFNKGNNLYNQAFTGQTSFGILSVNGATAFVEFIKITAIVKKPLQTNTNANTLK